MNLQPTRLVASEFARTTYTMELPKGHTLEDALKPEYWVHVAMQLKLGDHIEILAHDMSFYAEAIVIGLTSKAAKLHCYLQSDVTANTEDMVEDDDFDVKFRGRAKWSVVRKSDNAVIKEHLDSKEDAYRELSDHKKALAA